MRSEKRMGQFLLSFAGALLLSLLLAPRALADASGCTRIEETTPFGDATCWYSPNKACYQCEYSDWGGISHCAENEDGSIAYCDAGPFYPSPNGLRAPASPPIREVVKPALMPPS